MDSGEPKEPCISWGTGSLQGKGAISVAPGTRPFIKILVPLVTNYKLVKKINNAVLYVMKLDCLIIPCRVVSVVVVSSFTNLLIQTTTTAREADCFTHAAQLQPHESIHTSVSQQFASVN